MATLQLLILFVTFAAILALVKNRVLRVLGAGILGLVFVVQTIAVVVVGEVADDRFYAHLVKPGQMLELAGEFRAHVTILMIVAALTLPALYFSAGLLRRLQHRIKINAALAILGCGLMSTPGGILANAWSSVSLLDADEVPFEQGLTALGIPPAEYVTRDKLRATKGKNVIAISMESLERGYLREPLEHLTPNLRALRDRYSYYDMKECEGGGYTTASLYMTLTGIPAFMSQFELADFDRTESCEITTFADVLRAANYDLTYFCGLEDFMGNGDLLRTFGFEVRSAKFFADKYERSPWGLHDKDLFHEIESAVRTKASAARLFCIFASTVSTHFPDGVYDSRMEKLVAKQPSELEFMVSALDYHIGKLISLLKSLGIYEQTTIVLFPDHRLMGRNNPIAAKFAQRGLFVLSNAEPSRFTYSRGATLTQMDLPKIILEAAGIDHNAKFLTDFIPAGADPTRFIDEHKREILNLNVAAFRDSKAPSCADGFVVQKGAEQKIEIRNLDGRLVVRFDRPPLKSFYHAKFDAKLRLASCTLENDPRRFANLVNDEGSNLEVLPELIVAQIGDTLFACYRRGPFLKIAKKGNPIRFDRDELSIFDEWKFEAAETSKSTRTRYPCDLALPPACGFEVTSRGTPTTGSDAYHLSFARGPSPEGFQSFAFLAMHVGERYSMGLKATMPCKDQIILYPRLENPGFVVAVPVSATAGDPCGLRASTPIPIPDDPNLRGAHFSTQWLVLNWKGTADAPSWILTLSREFHFVVQK